MRFSWSTCTPILESRGVRVRWECDEDSGGQQTLSFGGSAAAAGGLGATQSTAKGRHSYFRARKLQRVHAF